MFDRRHAKMVSDGFAMAEELWGDCRKVLNVFIYVSFHEGRLGLADSLDFWSL
jgi:hypothetical protein